MKVSRSQWIGAEGRAFERVCLAFEALGYEPPKAEVSGAYATNIVQQYKANLSESEALDVIAYALENSVATLKQDKAWHGTKDALQWDMVTGRNS